MNKLKVFISKHLKFHIDSVNESTNGKRSEMKLLKMAVKAGNKSRVKELLQQEPRLDCHTGGKILWNTVLKDQLEIASMLIKAGANLDIAKPHDKHHSYLLHELLKYDSLQHFELAILIIRNGGNVNACDNDNLTPIYYAIRAKTKTTNLIKELLKHGARVDSRLIVEAASYPNAAELVSLLVNEIGDISIRSRIIEEALSYCAKLRMDDSKILPAVTLLLKMMLPVEEISNARQIFINAIRSNKIQMVQLLIEHGLDVKKLGRGGDSPLYVASTLQQSTITEMLIKSGVEVNSPSDARFYTGYAIHAACENNSVENIQMLLRHGADINVRDSTNHTPFSLIPYPEYMSAAHRMIIRYMAILVSKGQIINDCDLKIIEKNYEMHVFYKRCLDELMKMKEISVINTISFYAVFQKSVKELVYDTRNFSFVKHYERVNRKFEFPLYCEEMDFVFESVKIRKSLLSKREKALCESLEYVLPYIPLKKIIYYMYFNDA